MSIKPENSTKTRTTSTPPSPTPLPPTVALTTYLEWLNKQVRSDAHLAAQKCGLTTHKSVEFGLHPQVPRFFVVQELS
jgi:hypothetical protein